MLNNKSSGEDEIDLIEVARTIWESRKKILLFVLGFGIFGLVISLLTPAEYMAKTVMVTRAESRGSGSGNLSGLAAMVGINLGSSSDLGGELTPVDYSDFIKSLSFQKELMDTPIYWQKFPEPVTIFDYYSKYAKPGFFKVLRQYTIGLPATIVGWLRNKNNAGASGKAISQKDGLVYLSGAEQGVRGILTKSLKLTLNPNSNFIKIEASAPEAKAAAQMATKARDLLQQKVTELKINKATQNLVFTQGLYKEKMADFKNAQEQLAQFRDRNINLGSEMARTEEERLSSEYQIAFSVYTELAKQLEKAKIQVKEDTPIFSVIEEAVVPNSKSKPKTEMVVLIWIFLGGVIGVVWVLADRFLGEARKQWAEKR